MTTGADLQRLLWELKRRTQTVRYWEARCARLVAVRSTPDFDVEVASLASAHCFGHESDFADLVKSMGTIVGCSSVSPPEDAAPEDPPRDPMVEVCSWESRAPSRQLSRAPSVRTLPPHEMGNVHCLEHCCEDTDICELRSECCRPPPPPPPPRECTVATCFEVLHDLFRR